MFRTAVLWRWRPLANKGRRLSYQNVSKYVTVPVLIRIGIDLADDWNSCHLEKFNYSFIFLWILILHYWFKKSVVWSFKWIFLFELFLHDRNNEDKKVTKNISFLNEKYQNYDDRLLTSFFQNNRWLKYFRYVGQYNFEGISQHFDNEFDKTS